MPGYRISPGDGRRFKAAFRDTECVLCDRPIYKGEPIGYLDYYSRTRRFGPLCDDCISHQAKRFQVTTLPAPPK
jgi:hypothetical protein